LRTILLGILLLGFTSGFAQIHPDSSSFFYQAQPVEIVEEKSRSYNSLSENNHSFSNQPEYQTQDLATYLDRKGLAQININGATGSAAAIRFRGTSSDHTTLFWNGFSINSVSLGSADLSMIPLFFIDDATLISSPGASKLPGSNIGAGVELLSSHHKTESSGIRLIASYNTMDNSFTGVDVPLIFRIGKSSSLTENSSSRESAKLIVRTRFFDQNIQNNFKYIDSYHFDKPLIRQEHNNGKAGGAMNEIIYSTGAHKLEFGNWYQQKKINLPAIMGMTKAGTAQQSDALFRSSIVYNYSIEKFRLGFSTAFFDEATEYRDHLNTEGEWAIDSKIHSRGLLNRIDISGRFKNIKFNIDGLSSYYDVKNVSYNNGVIRKHWGQTGASFIYKLKEFHLFHVGVRYDIREVKSEPAKSFNYKILRNSTTKNPFLEMQISKAFRHADFNERFWFPSGNPNLRPESGLSYMLNVGLDYTIGKLVLSAKPSIFYNDISNWIQWIPQLGSIWSPVNFKRVRAGGVELPMNLSTEIKKFYVQSEIRYSFTESRGVDASTWNDEEDFVMIYSPSHILFVEFLVRRKNLNVGVHNKYTSSRYTDESNTKVRALAPYNLTGGFASINFALHGSSLECRLSVDNLLDVSYESVRAYAMPGRVIQLTLNYRFGIINKKNK